MKNNSAHRIFIKVLQINVLKKHLPADLGKSCFTLLTALAILVVFCTSRISILMFDDIDCLANAQCNNISLIIIYKYSHS